MIRLPTPKTCNKEPRTCKGINLITYIKSKIKNLLKTDTKNSTPSLQKKHSNQTSAINSKNLKKKKHVTPKQYGGSVKKQKVQLKKKKLQLEIKLPELKDIPKEEGKMRFSEFTLRKEILCGLQDAEFKHCTPIQEKCLPYILERKDIAGKAQTGTGKTAAFLISIFTHLLNNPPKIKSPGTCRVLIIAPTRELAIQIYKDAEKLGKYCCLSNAVVYGGMDYKKQQNTISKHIDILVGTPGRLLDYSRNRVLKLMKTEIFVIDEADRMLDMGFIPDVRRIASQLPPPEKRQTMLFSATLSEEIMRLVKRWQVEPVMIEIESEQTVTELIDQVYYSVVQTDKKKLLLWLLKNDNMKKNSYFCKQA